MILHLITSDPIDEPARFVPDGLQHLGHTPRRGDANTLVLSPELWIESGRPKATGR